MNAYDRFRMVSEEYLEFERVEKKKNSRPDIHALILLSELFPDGTGRMVCYASNDEIWLDITSEQVETLADDIILELIRCGVRCDECGELLMFV